MSSVRQRQTTPLLLPFVTAFAVGAPAVAWGESLPPTPPNLLWLAANVGRDELGCYTPGAAQTPNLDRLSLQGMRFTQAFRPTLSLEDNRLAALTGRQGTTAAPPVWELLRGANYFTGAAGAVPAGIPAETFGWHSRQTEAWEEFFRQRPAGQPFFLCIFLEGGAAEADEAAGRVLWQVDELGLADSTAVFFFGTGPSATPGQRPALCDAALALPLLVRWPRRIPAAATQDGLASLLDLMPTALRLAGCSIPWDLPGANLRPMLFDTKPKCRDAVVGWQGSTRTVRTEHHRLVTDGVTEEVYEVNDAEQCSRPLSAAAISVALRAELHRLLNWRWAKLTAGE